MFKSSDKNESFFEAAAAQISGLKAISADIKPHEKLCGQAELDETLLAIEKSFKKDTQGFEKEMKFIVGGQDLLAHSTALIRRWQAQGSAPSLAAICTAALDMMDVSLEPDYLSVLLMAAALGEVPNDQPYHDNLHYKKVLIQGVRMMSAHNEIYKDTNKALDTVQIYKFLTAICIHDLAHDGLGNVVKGVHVAGRLEKLSFEIAKPYLVAAGGAEDAFLEDILTMLLTTDVSPIGDPTNPAAQAKAAYRYHFMDEKTKIHALNLSGELKALETDEALTMLCLLLHEADVATSAGLGYDVTKYETSLVHEEFRARAGKPSDVINFLTIICDRKFLSDAGQKLYASNMARIYTLAQEDVQNGDHAYPSSDHSDFILAAKSPQDGSKTIN